MKRLDWFTRPLVGLSLIALVATLAFSVGCKPPPTRLGRTNSTDSNITGSNTTDGGVEEDDYGDGVMPPVDNVDNAGVDDIYTPDDDVAVVDTPQTPAEPKVPTYQVDPLDWPYWRGPHYNGVSYETGLIDDFDPDGGEGSNVAWHRDDLGTRSTPIVMRGKLYTLTRSFPGTAKEGERVICVDAATGETVWENNFNVWLSDVPDTRVGWSSVAGDPTTGRVYALGVCGYFQCIDGDTGETIWAHPLHEKFGFLSTYGGRTNFPIICDDQVIISAVVIGWGEMAKPAHRFVSFDKLTGEVLWFEGTRLLPYDTTYSAPALKVVHGTKSLIFGSGDGAVWGIQPRTGQHIWQYKFSRRGLNVSPLVVGDRVFTGHSEEVFDPTSPRMGSFVGLKIPEAASQGQVLEADQELWKHDEVMAGKSSPLLVDDRIYVFEDGGTLHIFDAKTGEPVELQFGDRKLERLTKMRNMRSSPIYADGKIYAVSEAGQWFIAKPNEESGLEFISYSGRDKAVDDAYASPIVSHGRLYITTMDGIYCLEDTSKEHGVAKAPEQPQETPVEDDPKPAHVQLVPAEVLLRPGEKVEFTARLYNANGQFLQKEDYPQFSIQGEGNITPGGKFTAPEDARHMATYVTATVGDISGQARIRIVPDLPWEFTFDGIELASEDNAGRKVGEPPITWVGMRYRHVIRDKDGNKVMVKVNTIPKGTRSQGWIGHPDLHDYTIQADVMGDLTDDQMPEIGITAQGYTLAIQGNNQLIQIRTWVTQERLALAEENRNPDGSSKTKFPFEWEANKWYTMKLKVTNEEEIARLQGKVWPQGEEEPEEWTIECIDPAPQRVGAPGFYGDANFAEIYIDNVQVTPNERAAE